MANDIKKINYVQRNPITINQCFIVLGAERDDVYSTYKNGKYSRSKNRDKFTIHSRYQKSELLGWAESLYKKAAKKYHPDMHKYRKVYYEKRMSDINYAYQRIRKILGYSIEDSNNW